MVLATRDTFAPEADIVSLFGMRTKSVQTTISILIVTQARI